MPDDPWPARNDAMAERLRALRTARSLSQEQLAEAAGISRNHVQMLERGSPNSANPRLSTLYRLAEALQAQVVDLLPPDATVRPGQSE